MNTRSTVDALLQEYEDLSEQVKGQMGENRFRHTLSVAKEACHLAKEFSLSEGDTKRLFVAALLHDVTKAKDFAEQITLARDFGITLTQEDLDSPPILHSLTGAAVAEREYARYTDSAICEAIRCHTVGKADMTLFDKLLFLADYIEETRSHPICQQTRQDFYQSLATENDKQTTLDHFVLLIAKNTLAHIESQGRAVHPGTKKTIESLSKKG